MMTKAELKYYTYLLQKKYRQREKKFLVEGKKLVEEGIKSSFPCEAIFVTGEFKEKNNEFLSSFERHKFRVEVINDPDFKKLCDTESPQGIAAVFSFNLPEFRVKDLALKEAIVCLENISDPGNVGTILRTCDWFGIKYVILTEGCVEIFNPKVIRGSMGSIFHLQFFENVKLDELKVLKEQNYKFICADLEGINMYKYKFPQKSLIFFCNEAAGPSSNLLQVIDDKVTIPKHGKAESLNVAAASAVILSQLKKDFRSS